MAKNKKYKFDKKKKPSLQKVTTPSTSNTSEFLQKTVKKKSGSFVLPGNWKVNAAIFLALVLATILLYSLDLHLGFFSVDDPGYVTDDPWIKSFGNLGHILTVPYFANYSPTHLLSYMIDYAIAGQDPYFFHLSSNIWAGIVAGFVFLVALALLQNRVIAIAAAILFVLHPAHVEAIAWISSRKDLVAAAFALPCLLTYLQYRKRGSSAKWWYFFSLLLFVFAVGGKLSVATFPAVLLAIDLFVERRPFVRSLIDKVPFLIVGILFALAVASAQPSSGNTPDPYVYMISLAQSGWLLTGFGSYVIYRVPPQPGNVVLEIAGALILFAVFLLPLFLRKRLPMVAVLIYWTLFTYLPSQVLSFVHPVTDRYLFMPSVAVVILIAWGVISFGKRFGQRGLIGSIAALLIIAFFWGLATFNYLNEWRDPRSVWFGAVKKSKDPDIYYSVGANYLNLSSLLGSTPRGAPLSEDKKEELANKVWNNDPRLPKLIAEWKTEQQGGPLEKEFQAYLWSLSEDDFKKALDIKGNRAMPHLYFRYGVLLLDKGDLAGAKKKFLEAIDEATRFTVTDVAQELTVVSYSNLGLVAMKQGDFQDALRWYRLGEEAQTRFGGNWVPDIGTQRKKMEATVLIQSGSQENANDPDAAYSLGIYYLNAANKLGTTPIEDSKLIANNIWKNDPQLSSLLSEWDAGQHGGPAERSFQEYLKKLAWDAFEKAVQVKGKTINSNLYFRRGMILGDRGDMNGARKEFLTALNEASQESNESVKKEITIVSQDALGILAWREKNYKEALDWFQKALKQQNEFGGNWVPDLNSKIKQMESMIASGGK